jgi:uncharacterized membrane protein
MVMVVVMMMMVMMVIGVNGDNHLRLHRIWQREAEEKSDSKQNIFHAL